MELVLVRHGDAAMQTPDAERPLTAKGREQCQQAAQWLKNSGWQPDALMVSPLRRARQTAEPFINHWPDSPLVISDALLSEGTPLRLVQEIDARYGDSEARLLLVGHNPLISELIDWLAENVYGAAMATASMALLEIPQLGPGCATLSWVRHYPDYERNAGF